MTKWSVAVGVLGILGTGAVVTYLSRRASHREPERYWLLGLAALLPAWLIAFVGLLGAAPLERRPELSSSVSWILSSSAALLGLILTDAALRRLRESGQTHRAVTYWLVGVFTFLPAWGIALLGLAMNVLGK